MTNETPTSWVALIKNLHRAIRNIEQYVQRLIHDGYKERRILFAAKLADDATGSLDFRTIREQQARPIQFLADGEGTLHTDPMMTDTIMTRVWAEVYKGKNITSLTSQRNNYATPSATSRRMPLRWLTRMLNGIENGMDWPRHITKAHATCIPKESRASHDPLAYRVLLIISKICRKWSTMRLKHLETWIQKWTLPQMHAGVPRQGAEQAWWQLSLCLEYWRAKQTQVTGRATDKNKCFNQVVTHLHDSDHTLEPLRVCRSETHSRLDTDRSTPGNAEYHKDALFSMTLTALCVSPWILQVFRAGAIPRVLADDLHVVAAGEKHHEKCLKATKDTHTHLCQHGGRANRSKQELRVFD